MDAVEKKFEELGGRDGGPRPELYPKGYIPPWHEAWLYSPECEVDQEGEGYMGFLLQATHGDCDYLCPTDMEGTYNYTAHSQLHGMTKHEAMAKYIKVVEAMFSDKRLVCTNCADLGIQYCAQNGEPCHGPSALRLLDGDSTVGQIEAALCAEDIAIRWANYEDVGCIWELDLREDGACVLIVCVEAAPEEWDPYISQSVCRKDGKGWISKSGWTAAEGEVLTVTEIKDNGNISLRNAMGLDSPFVAKKFYEEAKTLFFDPGNIGIEYRVDTGLVRKVFDESLAARQGVKVGWSMVQINGQPFAKPFFDSTSNQRRGITFRLPHERGEEVRLECTGSWLREGLSVTIQGLNSKMVTGPVERLPWRPEDIPVLWRGKLGWEHDEYPHTSLVFGTEEFHECPMRLQATSGNLA